MNIRNVTTDEPVQEPRRQAPQASKAAARGLSEIFTRWWWIVALVTLLALGGAAVYLHLATPIYTATARVYVEQTGPKVMAEVEGFMTQSQNYLYTQCELLKSTPILTAALARPGIGNLRVLADQPNPKACLKKALIVEVGRNNDIISVALDAPDPDEAAQLVNSVVDAYVAYHSQRQRTTAADVLKILQKEKVKRDAEMADRLRAILEFKRVNGALSFENERGGNIVLQRMAKLSDALTVAQLDAISAKAEYDAAKSLIGSGVPVEQIIEAQHGGSGALGVRNETAERRVELQRLQLQLVTLRQDCTADHPAVTSVQARIDQLQRELAGHEKGLTEAYLATVSQRHLSARAREEQTQTSFDVQQSLAMGLNLKAAEYAVLQTELQRTEHLSEILDTRIKEINVTEDAGALNISVVEPAVAETTPTKPMKLVIFMAAFLIGLLLGGTAAYLRELVDHRLRSSDEVAAALGLPVLAAVPSMRRGIQTAVRRGMMVHWEPKSRAAEAYRAVRTAVYFGVPQDESKVLLVTSPDGGDGKSTLASNLAIAMAKSGQRTLLLDADFRKPTQHTLFEVKAEKGLSNLLAGDRPAGDAVLRTIVEGLDLLPCGPIPPNPAELLNSKAFAQLLKDLSARYDHIVIDAPPVGPVTDACILGAIADVTLLVLRAEKSKRRSAAQARDCLLAVGARILGVIVNDVPRRRNRHYYGGSGYYHYGYGYGHDADDGSADTRPTAKVPSTVNVN